MAIAYIEVPLSKNKVAIVDIDDVRLLTYKWHVSKRKDTCYARRSLPFGFAKTAIYMHTQITVYNRTDHINGNGLDNRRSNLRQVTHKQNLMNIHATNGISKYKGVTLYQRTQTSPSWWTASIKINGKRTHLGYFKNEVNAALAYDKAARLHFGEFACLNFPEGDEQGANR